MYPVKLKPALKDYIWGGDRLKKDYGIKTDMPIVAEAWVLSCHKDGMSVIENGEYKGKTLLDVIEKEGSDVLGKKAKSFEFFPVLVKLIDAKNPLSVQVHPSDEYALEVEKEYGKTEMWYVVEADEGAALYYGFKENISKDEFKHRIADNTLCDALNKVEVKKGDCLFIEAGTIHAIGAGMLIAEIQQNSNTTYRVYDYGRVGADGKPRELHIEKATEVTELTPPKYPYGQVEAKDGIAKLAECKYFNSFRIELSGEKTVSVDDDSFLSLVCIDGEASVAGLSVKKGETVFIPAGFGELKLSGNATLITAGV